MDSYEATKIVFTRILSYEPENASKIMGYLLIQDHGEKEMIRLAYGPDSILLNLILKAKSQLGLLPTTKISPPSPSSSFNNPIPFPRHNKQPSPLSLSTSSLRIPDNGFELTDPSSPSSAPWPLSPPSSFAPLLPHANVVDRNIEDYNHLQGNNLMLFGTPRLNLQKQSYSIPGFNLNEFEQCQELMRYQIAAFQQQHKLALAQQLMAGNSSFIPPNNCMDLALLQHQIEAQRLAASALIKNEFPGMNLSSPGSRQIYLTFPADSKFREEDVSIYFSKFGPVQDVRIPYQQKRMFGFVTFLYPETVKLILAKGNPHFVCDSRVLVKPYKEKGKVPDKKQNNQHLDRVDHPLCTSPTGLECQAERMLHSTQEMLLAKKIEERANLQQAIELQGRRLMNLQLQDLNQDHHHFRHRHHQFHHGLSTESSIPSPVFSESPNGSQTPISPPSVTPTQVKQEDLQDAEQVLQEVKLACNLNKGKSKVDEESDILESIEKFLPDSLFASPKKSAASEQSAANLSSISIETNESATTAAIDSSSNLDIASPKASAISKCQGFLLGMEPLECN